MTLYLSISFVPWDFVNCGSFEFYCLTIIFPNDFSIDISEDSFSGLSLGFVFCWGFVCGFGQEKEFFLLWFFLRRESTLIEPPAIMASFRVEAHVGRSTGGPCR